MTCETVLKHVKAVSEACLDEISQIVSYVVYCYGKQTEDFRDKMKEFLSEVEEMKKICHTENPIPMSMR